MQEILAAELQQHLSARSMLRALSAAAAAPSTSPACFRIFAFNVYSSTSVGVCCMHCCSMSSAFPVCMKIMLERSAGAQLTTRACLMVDIHNRQLAVTYVLVWQPTSLQYLCHPCDRGAAQPRPLSRAAPDPWRAQGLTGQAVAGRRCQLPLHQADAGGVLRAPAWCLHSGKAKYTP